ncbi:MAG: hypothetical protein AAGI10_00040 [Pseudomonadota bacterium]
MGEAFDSFLEDISVCFIERDFELWIERLIRPFSLVTKTGVVVLSSRQETEANFNLYLHAMDAMNLDLVDRSAVSVEDCNDGTWLGTFTTRLLSNGVLATSPYTSTALLHWSDGMYRMSSMLNARGHSEWTGVNGV